MPRPILAAIECGQATTRTRHYHYPLPSMLTTTAMTENDAATANNTETLPQCHAMMMRFSWEG